MWVYVCGGKGVCVGGRGYICGGKEVYVWGVHVCGGRGYMCVGARRRVYIYVHVQLSTMNNDIPETHRVGWSSPALSQ